MNIRPLFAPAVLGLLLAACGEAPRPLPTEWAQRETVAGQPLPVPTVWLNGDPEARYTHNIKLPDSVPKPVPFDFKAAERKAWWPGSESVGIQYLRHLCATEAGEWTFKKVPSQISIYQARPLFQPDANKGYELHESPLAAWSSPPWDWRDRREAAGAFLIRPGPMLFETVEEPRRPLVYQQAIHTPYIRIQHIQGEEISINPSEKLISRFGISWRGTARERDRELGKV